MRRGEDDSFIFDFNLSSRLGLWFFRSGMLFFFFELILSLAALLAFSWRERDLWPESLL